MELDELSNSKVHGLFLFDQQLDLVVHHSVALGSLPFEFAIPAEAAVAFLVDEIDARPDAVAIPVPVGLVVIDSHWVCQSGILQFLLELVNLVLRLGFRGVDADEDYFAVLIAFLHFPVPGIVSHTVDSAKREEVNDHHLSSKVR